jgi:hypothetical protein
MDRAATKLTPRGDNRPSVPTKAGRFNPAQIRARDACVNNQAGALTSSWSNSNRWRCMARNTA